MIAERQSQIEVRGSLPGKKIAMGIDAGAMAHIMNVLTDLYSDPQLACIREYSTNAFDAHVEVGQKRPIEVTLPNSLSQFLRIRDYGVGLGVDDIESIYSQYGASTKRSTNDQVGMLGLGCKSALTYTSQFTLTSVRAGIKVQVAISRDSAGAGSMTVVNTTKTGEADGTEVMIPVDRYDIHSFEVRAREFFQHWQPGTVLVNGKQPKPVEGLPVGPRMILVKSGGPDKVVMGNVAYPMDRRLVDGLPYGSYVIAHVGIGEVHFPPSREALSYTPQTEATLKTLRGEYLTHAKSAVQDKIDKAGSHAEAIRTVTEWDPILRPRITRQDTDYTFKGAPLPVWMEFCPQPAPGVQLTGGQGAVLVVRYAHRLDAHQRTHHIVMEYIPDAYFFHGYEDMTFTPVKRKKLNAYFRALRESGVTTNQVYVSHDFPENVILLKDKPTAAQMLWIDPAKVASWDDVKGIKLVQSTRKGVPTGRIPGSYDLWHKADSKSETEFKHGVESNDINTKLPLIWMNGNRWESRNLTDMLDTIAPDGYSLVFFGLNRNEKFKRTFPEAIGKSEWVAKFIKDYVAKVPTDLKRGVSMRMQFRHLYDSLAPLDPGKVNDPDLKEAIRVARLGKGSGGDALIGMRNTLRDNGFYELSDKIIPVVWTSKPLKPYPLYDASVLSRDAQHVYDYLNAVYAWNTTTKGDES